MISFNHELSFKDINMREAKSESKTSVAFVMPIGCRPLEMPALVLKSMLKPQSLPASYQTKPPYDGIMLTSVSRLAAKTETVDTGSTFRAGSNTLRFAKYFASETGDDNAGAEMTEVSTSEEAEQHYLENTNKLLV